MLQCLFKQSSVEFSVQAEVTAVFDFVRGRVSWREGGREESELSGGGYVCILTDMYEFYKLSHNVISASLPTVNFYLST